jgi:hypothetical protein
MSTTIEGMDALHRDESRRDEGPLQKSVSNISDFDKQMKEEELSFYSASENEFGDDNIWGLLSGVGGNIYEWYVPTLHAKRE